MHTGLLHKQAVDYTIILARADGRAIALYIAVCQNLHCKEARKEGVQCSILTDSWTVGACVDLPAESMHCYHTLYLSLLFILQTAHTCPAAAEACKLRLDG